MPRFPNLGSPHNKSLRGVSDIAKWIACDQSQSRAVTGFQNLGLIRLDDGDRLHPIFEFTMWAHDVHCIALLYVSQVAKESIAMTRQHQVAALARTR